MNTLIRPYIGKRIKVTGTIIDVSSSFILTPSFVHLTCGDDGSFANQASVTIALPFWAVRQFVPLPKGTVITVVGRIANISIFSVSINSVEVVPNPQESVATST